MFIALAGLVLCTQYGVDGEQLAVLWLSFSTTNGYDSVTLEALEHLDRLEQSSVKRKAVAAAASANSSLNSEYSKREGEKTFLLNFL